MLQPKKPVVKKTTKKTKTVSQRLGDTTLRDVKNAGEDALQIATLGGYGKVKKALGGEYKHKKIGERKNGGKVTKAKNGKSFPDLNKDGKITKADILKGRGVIAKKGATIKKAQDGNTVRGLRLMGENSRKVSPNKSKYVSEDGNYKMKFKGGSDTSAPTSAVQRRTLKGFLKGVPKAAGKMALKSGGKMTKCKYGCK
jgi:hypothetical protein